MQACGLGNTSWDSKPQCNWLRLLCSCMHALLCHVWLLNFQNEAAENRLDICTQQQGHYLYYASFGWILGYLCKWQNLSVSMPT
eukprot:437563-Pelagomonas_calceolata.AAC.5